MPNHSLFRNHLATFLIVLSYKSQDCFTVFQGMPATFLPLPLVEMTLNLVQWRFGPTVLKGPFQPRIIPPHISQTEELNIRF